MNTFILALFILTLTGCLVFKLSILYALIIGYFIFSFYALFKKCTLSQLFTLSLSGISTVKNVLIIFFLIDILTALWRTAGTIPAIIAYACSCIKPSLFIFLTFVLNCLVSFLTGTSFGTAATMGVVCTTMASVMHINPIFTGGAVMSGIYFGDRCSPLSTSALLVSELTGTDLFGNLKKMMRCSLIPFCLSSIIYLLLGLSIKDSAMNMNIRLLFSKEFTINLLALLPAVIILILSFFKVNVKYSILTSIAAAFILSITVQHASLLSIFTAIIKGYHCQDPEVEKMLSGGGLTSMAKVAAIVCISSSYAGIFEKTGLLASIQDKIQMLSTKVTPFGSTIFTSAFSGMLACNQTLTIMLTHQLCKPIAKDQQSLAIWLENSAVLIAPLIPWSIACGVPLATIGCTSSCLLFACYLYLVPAWNLLRPSL